MSPFTDERSQRGRSKERAVSNKSPDVLEIEVRDEGIFEVDSNI
jgi:hypothetical protein